MKHAYLIIAHDQWDLLQRQLELLDHKDNDIYIHIDKKIKNFNEEFLSNHIKEAGIKFIDRKKIGWGGYSQIRCEVQLLKAAIKNNYDYYHLISGVDLPLKSQDYINRFFSENMGKEFIDFDKNVENSQIYERMSLYHIFQESIRSNKVMEKLEKILLGVQRRIGIDRIKNKNIDFGKGANWFSITNQLAHFLVSKEKEIKKNYRFTNCCDEIFIQTLIKNTEYYKNIYNKTHEDNIKSMRYIDWKRGNPYVFKNEDYDTLINSSALFGRKFNMDIDSKIIDRIGSGIKEK